jgi:AAA+ ATPase superfamily predicted ATPase
MKLYDNGQKTGHLLVFQLPESPGDNFSFFFPIGGLDDLDRLFKVNQGFEQAYERLGQICSRYELQGISINDIDRARENVPDIDEKRLCRLELYQFIDQQGEFVSEFADAVMAWFTRETRQVLPALRTGAIATGSSFFNREKEREEIREKVMSGKSILLQSPRRYGKSSLLKHIQQNPLSDGIKACYIDLQGAKSAVDFMESLIGDLMLSERCADCLPPALAQKTPWECLSHERIELKRIERQNIKKGWKEYANHLFACMDGASKKVLLIFDEFSYMLEDMLSYPDGTKEITEFMDWFANLRNELKHVSFILSGSEHLDTFLHRHSIDGRIDDLSPVHLDLFDPQTALSLMLLLFIRENISVTKNDLDEVLALMGEPIPFFLQVFVDLLGAECRRKGELTLERIAEIYDKQLLGPDSKRHFESVWQQLDRYGQHTPGGKEAAIQVLSRIAYAGNTPVDQKELEAIWSASTGSPDDFADILDLMKDDFYITVNPANQLAMASKLIRDWWSKHSQE